jgi:hypothetical protein
MPSTVRTMVRGGRLCPAVAAAVVLIAFTVSTAMAAAAPVATPAAELGTSANSAANPRTPTPGFLLDRGRYRGFDAPQARFSTLPYGISNHGAIVGRYDDGSEQAFLRDARGRFTTLAIPGARSAWASGINDRRQIVGYASDAAGTTFRGFRLSRGEFRTFAAPGMPTTLPVGINKPRPNLGLHLRCRWRDGPRVPAGQGHREPVQPDPVPRRPQHSGHRPQRPRAGRRRLREPQRHPQPAARHQTFDEPDA